MSFHAWISQCVLILVMEIVTLSRFNEYKHVSIENVFFVATFIRKGNIQTRCRFFIESHVFNSFATVFFVSLYFG